MEKFRSQVTEVVIGKFTGLTHDFKDGIKTFVALKLGEKYHRVRNGAIMPNLDCVIIDALICFADGIEYNIADVLCRLVFRQGEDAVYDFARQRAVIVRRNEDSWTEMQPIESDLSKR